MDVMKEGKDREFSRSDSEEEDGELSNDEETISSEGNVVEERGKPEYRASAVDGLNATGWEPNADHGSREETAITRLLPLEDEPREENDRSSAGSGVPSVRRSVSVETGLRGLKILEGDWPEKGERRRFVKDTTPAVVK